MNWLMIIVLWVSKKYFMPNMDSLYYLANTDKGQILINKRQIETAVHLSNTQTEIVMISGQKFTANLVYGDLMAHLLNYTPQVINPQ